MKVSKIKKHLRKAKIKSNKITLIIKKFKWKTKIYLISKSLFKHSLIILSKILKVLILLWDKYKQLFGSIKPGVDFKILILIL